MDPKYLWLTEALEWLTLGIAGPGLALVIAYGAWSEKNPNPKKSLVQCVMSVAIAVTMLLYWQRGVDLRSSEYFLQLACTLLSFVLIGVSMGYGFAVMLGIWRWHTGTRLKSPE